MSDNPTEQVLSDLFQYLEALETQCRAMLQFLKDKGLASDDEFSRYLTQAEEASSIKWRAARVRMEHLFAAMPERIGRPPETGKDKIPAERQEEQAKKEPGKSRANEKATAKGEAVATAKERDKSKPIESTERPKQAQDKASAKEDESASEQRRDIKSNASDKPPEESVSEPKVAESTKKIAEKSPESDQPANEKVA